VRYLSVCSGIEAASVAWHPLGWEPAAFCEIEAFPSAVLKERYPHVVNYGDFTRLSQPDHPIRSAGIDLLVGGTPCQAFSVAGLRKGLADPRGGLTLEFVRLAKALQPRWIVWENVPGVLSQDGGRAFGAFLGALGELGYGWAYRVLDAQYVRVDGYPRAVPQRRRRVFVVACAGGQSGRAGAVLFEPEGMRRDSPPRRETRQDAAASAAGGVEVAGCLQHRDSKGVDSDTKPGHILPVAFDARQTDVCVTGDRTHALRAEGADASEDGTGRGTPIVSCMAFAQNQLGEVRASAEVFNTINTNSNASGRNTPMLAQSAVPYDLFQITAPINRQNRDERSPCHTLARDNAAHAAVVQPMEWQGGSQQDQVLSANAVCPSLAHSSNTNGGNHQPKVWSGMSVRRLTPTECERLQGFPDGWTAIPWKGKPVSECPDGPRYRALGNSMAVNVMRWIGRRIELVEKT